jgi:branched-chain amino acid transport system ATP-binding protein
MAAKTDGLSLKGLAKRFHGLQALEGVDLEVPGGSVVGLIGPNGSGKTTLFNLVTGVYAPDSGEVVFEGRSLVGLAAHRIMRRGIARTFQNLRLFQFMTIYENVRGARHAGAAAVEAIWISPAARRAERDAVMGHLDALGLADRAHDLAATLPLADQRRVELARALAANPRLLLLDEPAGGMTPRETAAMAEAIATHAIPGRTVILIEHKIDMVAQLCPRLCVLNFGRRIAAGPTAEVLRAPDVLEAYLGPDPVEERSRHAGG